MNSALIIFVRNPILGKVKSRLAATVGDETALRIYEKLLAHTNTISKTFSGEKFVFYEDFVNNDDSWENEIFTKHKQDGKDLGERMSNAFKKLFEDNYAPIIIIGSDCFELTEEILVHAIEQLRTNDVVIGPATDGGYYLLGMKSFVPALFEEKKWSTASVYRDTIEQATQLDLSIAGLPVLNDVDYESDINF